MPLMRAYARTHEIAREIAAQDHESIADVLAKAVEDYRRRRFLERANEAYGALKSQADAWKEELEERAAWDETSQDGLEEDE